MVQEGNVRFPFIKVDSSEVCALMVCASIKRNLNASGMLSNLKIFEMRVGYL